MHCCYTLLSSLLQPALTCAGMQQADSSWRLGPEYRHQLLPVVQTVVLSVSQEGEVVHSETSPLTCKRWPAQLPAKRHSHASKSLNTVTIMLELQCQTGLGQKVPVFSGRSMMGTLGPQITGGARACCQSADLHSLICWHSAPCQYRCVNMLLSCANTASVNRDAACTSSLLCTTDMPDT